MGRPPKFKVRPKKNGLIKDDDDEKYGHITKVIKDET